MTTTVTMRCRCGQTYQFDNRRLGLRERVAMLRASAEDPRVIGDHDPTDACGDRLAVVAVP